MNLVDHQITNPFLLDYQDSIDTDWEHFQTKAQDLGRDVRPKKDILILYKFFDLLTNSLTDDSENKDIFLSLFKREYFNLPLYERKESFLNALFFTIDYKNTFKNMQFDVEEKLNIDLLNSNLENINIWKKEKIHLHQKNNELIENRKNNISDVEQKALYCHCDQCISKYRNLIRTGIFEKHKQKIEEARIDLEDLVLTNHISQNAKTVTRLKKNIDADLKKLKFKLKKSSLNKIDQQVKQVFDKNFGMDSEIFPVYKEKIAAFFRGYLAETDKDPDLIDDKEWDHFFDKLGSNIWRSENFLKREFDRYLRSLLTLKRKDVSSSILKEYIGQFWLHSPTRRKNRKIIYHMGPTNSGKTHHAIEALCKAKNGSYLAPLRLLASELYDKMNELGTKTCLITGEEVIEIEDATHYSSTIEMAKLNEKFECCVIDEIQMINDAQRGWAWTRALINLDTEELHLCGDDSVLELVESILKLTGDSLEIKNYQRMTELKVEKKEIYIEDLVRGDTLIVFSRKSALRFKKDLEKLGHNVSIVYGMLGPEVRREQAKKFDLGQTDVMVATDAIAMGMNLPIRRIVFSALKKFFNSKEHLLTNSEIKQISGRAGRFNRFPTGYVTCLKNKDDLGLDRINEALKSVLNQREKAMVGPDLDIFNRVNSALLENKLTPLRLTEFLYLFNDIPFEKPFYCVQLNEMIEVAEMVEQISMDKGELTDVEIFGFSCAPVNLGLSEHVQYFHHIVSRFANNLPIECEAIDIKSRNIDYLESSIKCMELFQWLARHFNKKNFVYNEVELAYNKAEAIERLNGLLSEKSEQYFYKEYRNFRKRDRKKSDGRKGKQTKSSDGNRGNRKYKGKRKFSSKKKSRRNRSK